MPTFCGDVFLGAVGCGEFDLDRPDKVRPELLLRVGGFLATFPGISLLPVVPAIKLRDERFRKFGSDFGFLKVALLSPPELPMKFF